MDLIYKTVAWLCVTASLPCAAQVLRFSGSVRAGETYRHALRGGLVLVVTTDEIRVRRAAKVGEDDNFAGCVNTPVRGPKGYELQAADFDPARGKEALGKRRSFDFVLSTVDEDAECAELARVTDPATAADNHWHSHPMGHATVTLSHIRLSHPPADPAAEIVSFRFIAAVRLPRKR